MLNTEVSSVYKNGKKEFSKEIIYFCKSRLKRNQNV